MYQVAIVEDDVAQSRILTRFIGQSPYANDLSVERFDNPSSFESFIGQAGGRLPDILFIRIAFAHDAYDGVEVVKRLAPAGSGMQVIYLATLDKYHTKVYQTEHVYLLTKPVVQSDLNAALTKALTLLDTRASRPVGLLSAGSLFILQPQKIVSIESDGHKVHIRQDSRSIEAYASLADLENRLPPSFVRCHKGFLVNMDYIAEL